MVKEPSDLFTVAVSDRDHRKQMCRGRENMDREKAGRSPRYSSARRPNIGGSCRISVPAVTLTLELDYGLRFRAEKRNEHA